MTNVTINNPSTLTLREIHDLLGDISMADSFGFLSPTDQKALMAVRDRIRSRLFRAGLITLEVISQDDRQPG